MMKKIFTPIAFSIVFLIMISLAAACKNPIIYNEYGVPINIYGGGTLTIKYSDYPDDAVIVDYVMSVKNTNEDQGLNLNFSVCPTGGSYCSQLYNYVFPANVSLEANEQKDVVLQVNVGGTDRRGELYIEGECTDTSPMAEGVIYVYIDGREDSIIPCKGTDIDCGMPGQCENVNQYDGCYDGYYRDYFCGSNTKQFKSMCTSYCCSKVGGTCKSNVCVVPHFSVELAVNITNSTGQPKKAKVKLYQPGTTTELNSSTIEGYGVISSPNATVDFSLEYDSSILNIIISDLNLIELSDTLLITLNDVSPSITNVKVLKAYMVTSSLGSFTGYLKFAYSTLSVSNEDALAIYKCSSYNMTSNSCDGAWIKQSTSIVNRVASTEITSFSAYALGEDLTVTTTTVPTTTTPSSSSGNGGDGGGGSYTSGKPSKITGFYDFPETLEVDAGSSETIYGEFYSSLWLTLRDVTFTVKGVDNSWYVVEPEYYSIVAHDQTKPLKITFNIPEDAEATIYPIEIEASSVTTQRTYTANFDLIVNPAPIVETTTTTTTTVTATTTVEKKEESGLPTGSFLSVLANNWYFGLAIPIVAIAVFVWKFLPEKIKFPSSNLGQFASIRPTYTEPVKVKKVVLKPAETKPKTQSKTDKINTDVDRVEKERRVKTRNKVIDEIRKRALEMDKKFK